MAYGVLPSIRESMAVNSLVKGKTVVVDRAARGTMHDIQYMKNYSWTAYQTAQVSACENCQVASPSKSKTNAIQKLRGTMDLRLALRALSQPALASLSLPQVLQMQDEKVAQRLGVSKPCSNANKRPWRIVYS